MGGKYRGAGKYVLLHDPGVGIAFLSCVGKPAVKHKIHTPCYPRNMEIFLAVTLIAVLIVLVIDTTKKRQAFLCQQEDPTRKH